MTEHLDVVIVGAGLSGIGAAAHLQRERPGTSYAVLESRSAIGGTWDLFRYPGVRSDSDMYTLGYAFRPWTDPKAIADGDAIRRYVRDTAEQEGVSARVRLRHRVVAAAWDSAAARWTLTVHRLLRTDGEWREGDPAEELSITCSFLFVCSGYYRYDEGYTPQIAGLDDFEGAVVHPQHWPDDLDVTGRRVVVIGSGATAVTLLPSLARNAASVTMLQRSPTYIGAVPSTDRVADSLRRRLPGALAYRAVRWKNVLKAMAVYQLSRRRPDTMRALLKQAQVRALPEGFDVETHLTPRYGPWDERLCAVPDGDLFRAIRRGRADIVTDRIERVERDGLALASGARLPADVIVTATGLNVLAIGGMRLSVDGRAVELAETLAYKGMMLSGVPNFALTIGYTNASWTLKADLVARYVCRLLAHMERRGMAVAVPEAPALDPASTVPLIDLASGYVRRGAHLLPRQGPRTPWRLHQNYLRDLALLRLGPVGDGMRFARAPRPAPLEALR
ncbi:NAD(P)/FAD-dependent oxidoreductase [Amnibacterium sp. CER49]|uniref:flavin-containing monooxygenase n=1 Tax=Amnibacterium sp. CER49 TaxID=3039161 RepID=UPI002449649F|nr:NAD(P)/FAD-dependent oxidoreductase [Amnibacterium sp. CER49]MDH2443720.1 NAD(P)/FAD-dependent oxidoreductase [Amnibacterium sp. CER49]